VNASVHDEELARWNTGGTGDPSFVSNRPDFHPAPRVRVDTLVKRGRASRATRARVLAEARSRGYWPFRLCHEAGLRSDPELSGETRIVFTLPRSGHARRPKLVASKLADRRVTACLVAAVDALRFVTPIPATLGVEIRIALWPGDSPLPSAPAPGASRPDLDVRAARSSLVAIEPRIADCFRAGRAHDPALWGRVALAIEVGADGAVTAVKESENQFPDPHVTRCVLGAVAAARFPAPPGGGLTLGAGVRLARPRAAESHDK
jgi:hypothetical protein